jgi:hypothetical protein
MLNLAHEQRGLYCVILSTFEYHCNSAFEEVHAGRVLVPIG